MEISREKTACIGVGYSTLADAFQAGREAAQMAKRQTPDSTADLAIAVGPADIHFRDFIEGVRLVTGEGALVGLPTPWVLLSEAPNARARTVLLIQAEDQRMSLVSSPEEDNPLVTVTSLMTDLRGRRGNARLDYDMHGLIAIDNLLSTNRRSLAHQLAADAGLESWIAGFGLWPGVGAPMVCGSQAISAGLGLIECLSNGPWGVGWVDTSAANGDLAVRREAAKASVHEALAQLEIRRPSAGLLLVASDGSPLPEEEAYELFRQAGGALHGVPLIGIPVRSPYIRAHGRTVSEAREGILSLLVPQ
jgi:hypothetical protein